MKLIILAGGGGTRLWPLSREHKPKQFSKIIGEKTLFEMTVERFKDDFAIEDIFVCLNSTLLPMARILAPQISEENYIIEPEKRDTAAAMGLIAAKLFGDFPDEPIAFIPSDHFIANKRKFLEILKKAEELIRTTGKMLDIAIQPTFPSTVLGYTKIGRLHETTNGVDVYDFLGHTEKPNFEVAQKYLEDEDYLWHASYYMWTPRKVLEAFERYSPTHAALLKKIVNCFAENKLEDIASLFGQLEKISFDYAVTEKIDPTQVLIIKGDFGWSDVGAFDVLYEAQKARGDSDQNVVFGQWVGVDTTNCLIYGNNDKIIATLGLDEVVVVDTPDALLVCKKSKGQDIKKIVEKLHQANKTKHL
jgi:mannose-1-phosphate guanylyltransferase